MEHAAGIMLCGGEEQWRRWTRDGYCTALSSTLLLLSGANRTCGYVQMCCDEPPAPVRKVRVRLCILLDTVW